jgi:hypothetical protein
VCALVATAVTAAVMSVPEQTGDMPALPRIETFISAACGGPSPCPSADRLKWLGELEALLSERMSGLPEAERVRLADVIYEEARTASLDPLFVLAVIAVESGFDHVAESEAGAVGLMQLRPATLQSEAERSKLRGDLDDPAVNVRAGVRYYRRLVRTFGSTDLALMAYNAGPNRILRYMEEGEIPERFHDYPRRIQQELGRLQRHHLPTPGLAVARLGSRGGEAATTASATVTAANAAGR